MEPKAALLCSHPALGSKQYLWKTLIFRKSASQGKADLFFLPLLKQQHLPSFRSGPFTYRLAPHERDPLPFCLVITLQQIQVLLVIAV